MPIGDLWQRPTSLGAYHDMAEEESTQLLDSAVHGLLAWHWVDDLVTGSTRLLSTDRLSLMPTTRCYFGMAF